MSSPFDQREHEQIYPQPGWVEHDPREIWHNVEAVTAAALDRAGLARADIAAVGITNQRETTLLWDAKTGDPVYNAIVWHDTRTDRLVRELAAGDADRLRPTGAACRSRPTSRHRRSVGCSIVIRSCASGPRAATSSSAPSTPGSSGS